MDFRIIPQDTKEASVYFVLNDRAKNCLLPIVKKIVATAVDENDINESESYKTRIYSDCYSSYQINDFSNLGYILKPVNHWVWFRNIVEPL